MGKLTVSQNKPIIIERGWIYENSSKWKTYACKR